MTALKYIFIFLFLSQPCYAYDQFPNVLFNFNKSTVDESALDTLNINPSRIGPNDVIWVKGYADPTGDEAYNQALSRKRAEFLRHLVIQKYNLKDSQVRLTEFGEDQRPGIPNSQKRRVEIIIGDIKEIEELMAKEQGFTENKIQSDQPYSDKPYEDGSSQQKSKDPSENTIKNSFAIDEPEKETPYKDFKNKNPLKFRYTFGGGSYYNVLNAIDKDTQSKAEWISKKNYNAELALQFNRDKLWLGFKMAFHIQDYLEPDTNSVFLWDKASPNLMKFSLTSDYERSWWSLGLDIDYNQTPYIHEKTSNIQLKNVFMLGTSLRGQARWLDWNHWSSRLGVKLSLPITGMDDIESKGELGYMGFVNFRRDKILGHLGLDLMFYYGLRNYTNNQNDQEDKMAGLILSIISSDWM